MPVEELLHLNFTFTVSSYPRDVQIKFATSANPWEADLSI